ncbi:Atp5f1c [Phodopus roborovskii]|uniref:ATP synthase F(1) complex subunit gamma, mitochondrial n=2 Tax=Muroidea TaxID=337687 RepID=A0AAU9YQM3_PHORO|nr:Atp5f1c [Phodopus roborovskii]
MATLKDITRRLKSIKNIQKITKSMKMVAAAKYARAERELKPARVYGTGSLALYEKAEIKGPEDKKKHLLIGVSSDRGLCGAIHSSVAKQMKNEVANLTAAGKEVMIVGIGEKIRGILYRTHSDQFLVSFKDVGRKPPTFGDASVIALELLNSGYEFDEGSIIFNQFKSVISYKTEEKPIFSLNTIATAESMSIYDDIDADVLQNYQEYSLANIIYYSLKESTTSEQSARMTAMDNASKNASDMIDKLTLTFNRTRQAVITKELIEIISGAAALDEIKGLHTWLRLKFPHLPSLPWTYLSNCSNPCNLELSGTMDLISKMGGFHKGTHGMCESYSRSLLRVSVAQICQALGWDSVQLSACHLLTDVLQRYLQQLGRGCHRYSELYGRTDPILDDVSEAFQLMGVNLHELEDYIHNIEPVTFPHQIPSFPVSKNNVLQFPQPGSKDAEERKDYIPDYLPPIVSSQEDILLPLPSGVLGLKAGVTMPDTLSYFEGWFSVSFLKPMDIFKIFVFRNTKQIFSTIGYYLCVKPISAGIQSSANKPCQAPLTTARYPVAN